MIKTIFPFAILALAAAVSCSPSTYTLTLDMRQPSASGIDLGGKSVSVVYVDNGRKPDSTFLASVCEGFATKLEEELFNGEQAVTLYRLPETKGASYSSIDTLHNLVMDTGSDAVFVMEAPGFDSTMFSRTTPSGLLSSDSLYMVSAVIPFSVGIHVFDSMDKRDIVQSFTGKNKARSTVYSSVPAPGESISDLARLNASTQAAAAGKRIAESFSPTWKTENYSLYYYESDDWYNALAAASEFQWNKAVDYWLEHITSHNLEMRACAEYNIALACYMMGKFELALEWISQSEASSPLALSPGMRKRIENKMQ